jgi:Ribbon-helix-helix protein, copG family
MTHMEKTQVYLRRQELDTLREVAARSGRSIAELIRDAIRKTVLNAPAAGPAALWDGEPKRTSVEHENLHDEPWCGRSRRSSSIAERGSRWPRERIRIAYAFDHHSARSVSDWSHRNFTRVPRRAGPIPL